MSLLWTKDKMWINEDHATQIAELLRSGWRIGSDGQMRPSTQSSAFDIPWVFVGDHLPHRCGLWNENYFRRFKLIPKWCRTKCHKVVVSLPNIAALMDFYALMQFLHANDGLNGKLGMDVRTYTWGLWKAFFYNTSLENGYTCLRLVREKVVEHIAGATVMLKKGCTEMERISMGGRPSNTWGEPTEEEIDYEDHLESIFYQGDDHYSQPPWLKQKIILNWWLRAYGLGDPSLWELVDRPQFEASIGAVRSVAYEEPPRFEEGGDPA